MPHRSPLALAVLVLLAEAPMHPYRIQQLIKERGKDRVVYVGQRSSLYKTIDRLVRDGLIVVHGTTREATRPERTVYAITEDGRETALVWLREMLSTPRAEFPEFPAALASLAMLSPDDARRQLELRQGRLEQELAAQAEAIAAAPAGLPRLFLLEEEFIRAVTVAELQWIRSVVEDLRAGRISWSAAWLAELAAKFRPEGP